MQTNNLFSMTTMLGFILILIGLALIVIPLLSKYFMDVEKIHPLLLVGVRVDNLYIGTSPILIIAILAIYLFLRYYS